MEELIAIPIVAILFIGLPWLIFHYVTRWKTAGTLTGADEKLLDELHDAARRLDDRLCTIERIMTAENPDWRQQCLPEQRRERLTVERGVRNMSTQPPSRTRFYRDTANGKVMGVCAGIADYTGMDVNLVRVMLLAAIVLGSGSPILIYFIAGWMTPKKPRELISGDAEEQRFWQGVRASPTQTARNIRSRMREIDRRLADIESYVTTENRTLAREIEQLR